MFVCRRNSGDEPMLGTKLALFAMLVSIKVFFALWSQQSWAASLEASSLGRQSMLISASSMGGESTAVAVDFRLSS